MADDSSAATQWIKQKVLESRRAQPALVVGSVVAISVIAIRVVPAVGVYAAALALVLLVAVALIFIRVHRLATIAAIIPLSYWIVLCLPQQSKIMQTVYLYGSLLLLGMAYRHMFAREVLLERFRAHKLRKSSMFFMASLGMVLGATAFYLLSHAQPLLNDLFPAVALAITCALIEVIFFQGLLQPVAARIVQPFAAAVLTGILFASMTWADSLPSLLVALLFGLVLAGIYYNTQSIAHGMIVNVAAKLTFVILPAFVA